MLYSFWHLEIKVKNSLRSSDYGAEKSIKLIEIIYIFKIKNMGVGGTVIASIAVCLLIGLVIELKERHL